MMLSALLPTDFSMQSRVWVYQAGRPFSAEETAMIDEQLLQFYAQWTAHGEPVKGWARLLYGQFVVVMADETGTHVSGCSTDGMVRVIKSLERQFSTPFFDRMTLTFLKDNKAEMLPMNQVTYALEKGFLTPETPFFNNTVTTLGDLRDKWIVPLKDSWLGARLGL
ncbi:MAG: hypothetical protein EOP52_11875 [Sphingobacteriales bacterium]|nr:MAG: hypothetical protein EOP52_11875 [Sphingobacteriales bacterium]